MDTPKHVVCMQGVEGFIADYGDLDLARAKAIDLCQRGTDTYVLSPVEAFTAVGGEGIVVAPAVVTASPIEREVAASAVIQKVLRERKAR